MDASTRAPGYDLFKLIVAIILLLLFLFLSWRGAPQSPTPTSTLLPNPSTTVGAIPTAFPTSSTSTSLTSTPVSIRTSTATSVAISTQTPLPSQTATGVAATTAAPLPSQTPTPLASSTSTPIAATPAASACDAASSRSRLQTGMNATILRRLNFRSSPGIRDNWLLTNIPGTKVEVVGGPECVPHFAGAYVWWQLKLPDGQIGWSAEASQYGSFYFMEPAQ